MIGLRMSLTGVPDLDRFEVDAKCPRCGFHNSIWIRQARLRDVIICRGCKANIQLDDGMNTVRKGVRNIRRAFQSLQDTINRINRR